MAKSININIRLSEEENEKLNTLRGSKTISNFIRDVIINGAKVIEESNADWKAFTKKLEHTDTSKLAADLKVISEKLDKVQAVKTDVVLSKKLDESNEYLAKVLKIVSTEMKRLFYYNEAVLGGIKKGKEFDLAIAEINKKIKEN